MLVSPTPLHEPCAGCPHPGCADRGVYANAGRFRFGFKMGPHPTHPSATCFSFSPTHGTEDPPNQEPHSGFIPFFCCWRGCSLDGLSEHSPSLCPGLTLPGGPYLCSYHDSRSAVSVPWRRMWFPLPHQHTASVITAGILSHAGGQASEAPTEGRVSRAGPQP